MIFISSAQFDQCACSDRWVLSDAEVDLYPKANCIRLVDSVLLYAEQFIARDLKADAKRAQC